METKFLNRCRACAGLQECSEKMISLFEKNLSEMFTNCTSLEIASNDTLPSHICFECYGHLSNFHKFRQNCMDSDIFLREQIVTESIKIEPLDQVVVKYEENEPNQDLESELYESEYIDEDFSQDDSFDQDAGASTADNGSFNAYDSTKYICDYCGQEFAKKSHIGSHMTKHKNETMKETKEKVEPETFPCTVVGCYKVFGKRQMFNRHRLNVHKLKPEPHIKVATVVAEKRLKLNCQQCPKWFTIQYKLDAHIRRIHENLKPYKCPHCEKEFCKSRSYFHHLKFVHSTGESKEYKCTYSGCDREYGLLDSLKTHINRCHLGIIPERKNQKLICEQCGRSFKNGFNLKEHLYTHSGILPFACKICPKKFLSNYKLKIHTMRHEKIKPFECPTCGQRKTTNKELQAHLNFHSKAISYPCKECPRVFTSYGAVSRHVRIHHRNHKPYICPHCQRAFSKAETMKNHVMTHTGEKPFACSECGHRFIQSVALKAHMRVHAKKLS